MMENLGFLCSLDLASQLRTTLNGELLQEKGGYGNGTDSSTCYTLYNKMVALR